ncbi:site-specific integrase [Methanolapillus millepedarum]|uniref:Tyrosine recombinase XerC n=1 Tax=Methanolapillus millepedarum TaxID=3028296 RepID=A0AA96V469_9EURY|nr:Tyrosine recombinase XerC [Methanosarcinaceae archaeon Ac7]
MITETLPSDYQVLNGFEDDCSAMCNPKTAHKYVRMARLWVWVLSVSKTEYEWKYQDYRPHLLRYLDICKNVCKISAQTWGKYLGGLNSFFLYLMEEGIVSENPVVTFQKRYRCPYKIVQEERQIVDTPTLEDIITWAGTFVDRRNGKYDADKSALWKCVFVYYSKSGMRREELPALNISNFDIVGFKLDNLKDLDISTFEFSGGVLNINSHAKRTNCRVPLDKQMVVLVLEYWKIRVRRGEVLTLDSPAFLGGGFKERINGERIRQYLQKCAVPMGIHKPGGRLNERFSPHCLRHWFTTEIEESPIKDSYVEELRGDKRSGSKGRYHHIPTYRLCEAHSVAVPELRV